MAFDFAAHANKLKKSWAEANKARDNINTNNLEAGTYIGTITEATIGESVRSERVQIRWTWVVTEGDHTGATAVDFTGLDTTEALTWFARRASQLGYDTSSLDMSEIPELIEGIVAEPLKIKFRVVESKEGYLNIRILKLLGTLSKAERTAMQSAMATANKPTKAKPEPEPADDENEDEDEDTTPPTRTKKPSIKDDEDEDEDDTTTKKETETLGIEEGDKVSLKYKNIRYVGIVKSIDADDATASVNIPKIGKTIICDIDDLVSVG